LRYTSIRQVLPALALLLCAGCAGQATPAPPDRIIPSPTIAIATTAVKTAPSPQPPVVALQPVAPRANVASQPTAASARAAEPSIYLWPTYLPPGMRPSPTESRVSSESQAGPSGMGFYVVTLNTDAQKLSIGGGDIQDVLPLNGEEKPVTAGTRAGKLISSGERREIVLDVPRGKLFLYSSGLSEDELIKVAESLQPIDVRVLREMAGVK
jgi:hypothetical protein